VIPGTEDRVIRAPDEAWFTPGSRGTRPRRRWKDGTPRIDLLVSHWTAGAEHEDEAGFEGDLVDDAGIRVFRSMRGRKRPDGSPMEVGCELVIAACSPSERRAEIWQLADPFETACVHVSKAWNPRSIGIERCMPGTRAQAEKLRSERPVIERVVAGVRKEIVDFYPGELESFRWLIETLAAHCGVPRTVPAVRGFDQHLRLMRRRMTTSEARAAKGLVEHYLSPSTSKYDTGTLALEQALSEGWELREP